MHGTRPVRAEWTVFCCGMLETGKCVAVLAGMATESREAAE